LIPRHEVKTITLTYDNDDEAVEAQYIHRGYASINWQFSG
jgi:hypothetical protein